MNIAKFFFLKILCSHGSLIKYFILIKLERKNFYPLPSPPGKEHCVILLAGFPKGFFLFDESAVVTELGKARLAKDIAFIYPHRYSSFKSEAVNGGLRRKPSLPMFIGKILISSLNRLDKYHEAKKPTYIDENLKKHSQ